MRNLLLNHIDNPNRARDIVKALNINQNPKQLQKMRDRISKFYTVLRFPVQPAKTLRRIEAKETLIAIIQNNRPINVSYITRYYPKLYAWIRAKYGNFQAGLKALGFEHIPRKQRQVHVITALNPTIQQEVIPLLPMVQSFADFAKIDRRLKLPLGTARAVLPRLPKQQRIKLSRTYPHLRKYLHIGRALESIGEEALPAKKAVKTRRPPRQQIRVKTRGTKRIKNLQAPVRTEELEGPAARRLNIEALVSHGRKNAEKELERVYRNIQKLRERMRVLRVQGKEDDISIIRKHNKMVTLVRALEEWLGITSD